MFLEFIYKVSIARSQGLVKSYWLVGHTSAAAQPGKKKFARDTYFHKNLLSNLESELLTHSVIIRNL